MASRVQTALLLAAFSVAGTLQAEPPPAQRTKANGGQEQEALARKFKDFEQALLRLTQRYNSSKKPEDRARAASLKKALELIGKEDVNTKFDKLISILKSDRTLSLTDLEEALRQQETVAEDINAILLLLLDGDRLEQLRGEIKALEQLLRDLDNNIRAVKTVRAALEGRKAAKEAVANSLGKTASASRGIAKNMGGGGKPGSNANPDRLPGKEQVEEAAADQDRAKKRVQDEPGPASNDLDDSVKKLQIVRNKIAEILRQRRKEETERVLADLRTRCERMRQMQIQVRDDTQRLDQSIAANVDKKPTRTDSLNSISLANQEGKIVTEATRALQILEAEGRAVVFPEVFIQLRDDMTVIERRLGVTDVGVVTQAIEQDVIDTLRQMIEALKKAQDDLNQPPPLPPDLPRDPGPRKDPRFIEPLAELKMIRSLQAVVNKRTEIYAKQYQGEQAFSPEIQRELKNLATREEKIRKATRNVVKEAIEDGRRQNSFQVTMTNRAGKGGRNE